MKWPTYLMMIRHDVSEYNVLKSQKEADPLYRFFARLFDSGHDGLLTRFLARQLWRKYSLNCSDAATPLVDIKAARACATGRRLRKEFSPPDVIFVSPYLRANGTLAGLTQGWPELKEVRRYIEERVREQEHGLSLIYNDWRIFQTLHPKQRRLYEQEGMYWYRYPQGENVPDVRQRNLLVINTITRDWAGQKVLIVCHHLNILAMRANLERLSAEDFIRLDKEERPINCGVTVYRGHPKLGQDGRLLLESYNQKCY